MDIPFRRFRHCFAVVCCVGIVMMVVYANSLDIFGSIYTFNLKHTMTIIISGTHGYMTRIGYSKGKTPDSVNKQYKMLWYNVPHYVQNRPDALSVDFSLCPFSNCEMSFNKSERMNSDAILFDGRFLSRSDYFNRSVGQVWIFAAHESPATYDCIRGGSQWREAPWRNSFNWTMTYNKFNTDIHLPYGTLKKKSFLYERNYTSIAMKKTDGALMISSHCGTLSKRLEYANELSKYFPVTVLGTCGTPWDCGTKHHHDNCFDLLNTTYKFYLAFENALCTQYFTEKIFENFNYDIIIVTRGGNQEDEQTIFPKGTQISAEDFNSARDLGLHLKSLSDSSANYAKMLETKSAYFSPPYKDVYRKALCDLCERMNFQTKYHKTIPNIEEWAYKNKPCINVDMFSSKSEM